MQAAQQKVIVTGATGRLGQAVMRTLNNACDLAAVVRSAPDARLPQDVQQHTAALLDEAALIAAFTGKDHLVAILPDHPAVPAMMGAMIAASKAAGVQRIIKISAHLASEAPPRSFGIEHAPADALLRASGLEAVILRPAMFIQSLSLFLGDMAKGRMILPVPTGKVALIDAADVAAVVAKAVSGEVAPGTYMLTGPQSLSFSEVAAQLAAWTGQPLKHTAPPLWLARIIMRFDSSLDAFNRARLIDFLGALEQGLEAPLFPDLERILGRPGRTFSDLLKALPAYNGTAPTLHAQG